MRSTFKGDAIRNAIREATDDPMVPRRDVDLHAAALLEDACGVDFDYAMFAVHQAMSETERSEAE